MDIKKVQKFNEQKELKTENDIRSRGNHVTLRGASGFVSTLFKGIGNIWVL